MYPNTNRPDLYLALGAGAWQDLALVTSVAPISARPTVGKAFPPFFVRKLRRRHQNDNQPSSTSKRQSTFMKYPSRKEGQGRSALGRTRSPLPQESIDQVMSSENDDAEVRSVVDVASSDPRRRWRGSIASSSGASDCTKTRSYRAATTCALRDNTCGTSCVSPPK
jgi:hypothetical protein